MERPQPTLTEDQETFRRAASAALAGLFVQIALSIVVAIVGLAAHSPAMNAATWHMLGGIPIWIILVILFHQHRLERAEALESEQLARSDAQTAAIFDERTDELQIARRRLANLYKWGFGIVSLLLAAYLLILGGVLLYLNLGALAGPEGMRPGDAPFFTQALGAEVNTLVLMAVWAGVGLGAFLVARYIAGMTRINQWQLLRGGASYLMGNTLVAVLTLAGIVCAHMDLGFVMAWLRLVVPGLMVLIGTEVLLTFLMAAYRPRRADEVPRPAFDSRVLGLLTTPESIAKAVSETINYQFGFEVSRSWFYGLLARSVTPLVVFALLTLVGVSSVVIVSSHEQAIVTRFGQIVTDPPLEPGFHLKRPWPFASARAYDVQRVHQLTIGSLDDQRTPNVPILWTNEHTAGEESYLVTAAAATPATPETPAPPGTPAAPVQLQTPSEGEQENKTPPSMSLVATEIVVHYQISDLIKYVHSSEDPAGRLEAIAERAVNAYFVTKDIDSLIMRNHTVQTDEGPKLVSIGDVLHEKIASNTTGMGVKILTVSVAGVHPPQKSDVALSFHKRISALQEKQSIIEKARRQSIEQLATVAGTEQDARRIHDAILAHNQAKAEHGADSDQVKELESQINRMLFAARGDVSKKIYEARAERWRRALASRTRAERFRADLVAYRAAPEYYRVKRYLSIVAEGMKDARKVLVSTSASQRPIYRLNLTQRRSSSIADFTGEQ